MEALASGLRLQGVRTYASHSSLSRDQRLQAETAFAQGTDCVIVATGTLELGIDVGDLDRVIQVDAPHSVASFLQRIGRSGRRTGSTRNCLFLATGDAAFLRALAIVHLWARGYVEPVEPPPAPYHVLAQQVLARVLQEGGAPRDEIARELARFCRTAGIALAELEGIVAYMLEEGILFEDGGILGLGEEGRALYGARNYLELFSVFLSPPLFTVFHGSAELGQVHELTFRGRADGAVHLSLGGRTWRVRHVHWSARRAYVEPGNLPGRSRWLGSGQPMRSSWPRPSGTCCWTEWKSGSCPAARGRSWASSGKSRRGSRPPGPRCGSGNRRGSPAGGRSRATCTTPPWRPSSRAGAFRRHRTHSPYPSAPPPPPSPKPSRMRHGLSPPLRSAIPYPRTTCTSSSSSASRPRCAPRSPRGGARPATRRFARVRYRSPRGSLAERGRRRPNFASVLSQRSACLRWSCGVLRAPPARCGLRNVRVLQSRPKDRYRDLRRTVLGTEHLK